VTWPPRGGGRSRPPPPAGAPPATRPGALRDLVEDHLRKFPGTAFTPHQVGKVLTRSAGAVANALDKLVSLGVAQMVTDKPRTYQLATAAPAPDTAPAPDAAPGPGRGQRPRHQRGDCGQRRVTSGPRERRGRDGSRCRPGRAVCTCARPARARPACGAAGRNPSRRAGRRPPPPRYIKALTGTGPRQYTAGKRGVQGRLPEADVASRNNRVSWLTGTFFGVPREKGPRKPDFCSGRKAGRREGAAYDRSFCEHCALRAAGRVRTGPPGGRVYDGGAHRRSACPVPSSRYPPGGRPSPRAAHSWRGGAGLHRRVARGGVSSPPLPRAGRT